MVLVSISILESEPNRIEITIKWFHEAALDSISTLIDQAKSTWKIETTSSQRSESEQKILPGKPGRPSYPEDIWAIEQIWDGRDTIAVKNEWLVKPEVKARKLQDAIRHFRRLESRAKRTKPDKT